MSQAHEMDNAAPSEGIKLRIKRRVATYKKPSEKRNSSNSFFRLLMRSRQTGTMGMKKMMKSVTMFMLEVRYQTGRL